MKQFFLVALCCLFFAPTHAQDKTDPVADTVAPYLKYPKLPAFNILSLDSSEVFNTFDIPEGKYTLLMLFGADCSHCQHFTEKMTAGMDSLRNIQIYMMSPSHLSQLREFYKKYNLGDYKNIKMVGRDYDFFFYSYYGAKYVPFLALYDKHKKLVKGFPDGVTVRELYELTHKR